MKLNIGGHQITLGESLREYVKERLEKSVHKFFDQAISANVVFERNAKYLFRCTIRVNEGTGNHMLIQADCESDEIYSSFDFCLAKIEKQLRRYKQKIKNHHKKSHADLSDEERKLITATKYVLSPYDDEEHKDDNNPVIIAEKPTHIEELTVAEAVMKMDLAHLPALIFTNKASGKMNIVYYRKDGNISWVEPKN
ncbi:MAG: ribosome-associated translation inhibitor RaiA [Sphingobacteriia bacterium]|nr:ribosome-associated translation inhibitor RaiA [Sphingobacteriia bacterium]